MQYIFLTCNINPDWIEIISDLIWCVLTVTMSLTWKRLSLNLFYISYMWHWYWLGRHYSLTNISPVTLILTWKTLSLKVCILPVTLSLTWNLSSPPRFVATQVYRPASHFWVAWIMREWMPSSFTTTLWFSSSWTWKSVNFYQTCIFLFKLEWYIMQIKNQQILHRYF